MTEIIEFIIALVVVAFLFSVCARIYKRIYLMRVMKRISKLEGVSVNMLKNPILSLLRFSKEAEYTVDVYGKKYAIRTYDGMGSGNAVHFANEKFTVVYSRLKTGVYAPRSVRFITLKGFSIGAKVRVLPELIPPRELVGRDFCEVIIFNPSPTEVSYVSKEKTSIKIAFTGDEMYGRKIFTASTFEIYVDREARRIKDERLGVYYNPWAET